MSYVSLLLATASLASAHVALYCPATYGFNGVITGYIDTNTNAAVNPLYNLTFDNFWFGKINNITKFPPVELEYLNLVAGGTTVVELAHNRAETTYSPNQVTDWPDGRNHTDTPEDPYQGPAGKGPGGGPGCIGDGDPLGEGNLHTFNRSFAAGSALAISYVDTLAAANLTNLVVISTAPHTPFNRLAAYKIPAGLPPCGPNGCICSWLWVPDGCGTDNVYMHGIRCNVTGATAPNKLLPAKPAKYCGDNPNNCVKGSKQVHIWNQRPGVDNVVAVNGHRPLYNPTYGYADGAQTDIFQSPFTAPPSQTASTYTATSTATPIISTTATPTVVPSYRGWNSNGCYNDTSNNRGLQYSYSNANMTVNKCVLLARSFSLRYAAVEFGTQCFMGNAVNSTSQPTPGCNMRCPGNQGQLCGGSNLMNLYTDSTWTAS